MQQIKLGEAMQRRRIDLRLSQEEVCQGICDVATLSRLENGRQSLAFNRVRALMQRLNMPDDRYYALLNQQEMELDNVRREYTSRYDRLERAEGSQRQRLWTLAAEQLQRLEELTEQDDTIAQQFILGSKALLGREDGPYSLEERLEMQVAALRLTVPEFDLERMNKWRYSFDEAQLINQIAGTYSKYGEHGKALALYRQMYEYANKSMDCLSTYAPYLTLVAHNYARELGIQKYYYKSIEVAEQGRRVGVDYGYYRFLPGFLAIMGECCYQLGEEERSKDLCLQAHFIYRALGDMRNLSQIDPDIRRRFGTQFSI